MPSSERLLRQLDVRISWRSTGTEMSVAPGVARSGAAVLWSALEWRHLAAGDTNSGVGSGGKRGSEVGARAGEGEWEAARVAAR